MRILIIGASGFVGAALCRAFSHAGHEVIGLSRSPLPDSISRHVTFLEATLDDRAVLDEALAVADFVFHLAWDTTPGTSAGQPVLEIANNLLPSATLLDALQRHRGLPVVFMSTGGALFASTESVPLSEMSKIQPRSYYGAGKAAIEFFLEAFAVTTGSPAVILRASNLYGPGQRAKRQFAIIPTLLKCALHGRPFQIWGDGTVVRDFLYIDDFSAFCLRLLDWQGPRGTTSSFNLGSGRGISINALCDLVDSVTGMPLQRQYTPARGVDMPFVTMNVEHAYRELGWVPTTTVEDGLTETWRWFKSHG